MTSSKPFIKIKRLLVLQGSHTAFDCEFHSGINVVRGRNSSGKTTIMDLLAYSLGAENIRWKPEALKCSSVFVEVYLTSATVTLQRDIATEAQRPITIFWGPLSDALQAGPDKWERYPFRRSENKLSFSQSIFASLGLPQAQGDGASNLTMHQLLRVLYADQPSVHSPIFRLDAFDSALTREMVGSYLCGVYDDELYTSQLRIREISKDLDKKVGELRGIFSVLGRSGQTPDLEMARNEIPELEDQRNVITQKVLALKTQGAISKQESSAARRQADDLRRQLNSARQYESTVKDGLAAEELDIADSILFVKELERRLESLQQSKSIRELFDNVVFHFCPSCLSEVKAKETEDHSCQLCSAPANDNGEGQILRMKNELTIQIKESHLLLSEKQQRAAQLRNDIPLATKEVNRLEKLYKNVASHWSSDVEILIEEASRKLGSLDEEIRQAYERQKLASVISELQRQRDTLQSELNKLNEKIRLLESKQDSRKLEVANTVESHMIRLLKLDLALQPEFINPQKVNFDFVDNSVHVNGSKNFSESSAVVLRHVFHLALFSTALEKEFMRLPRFMMLDGIDDGGMEKERSHNLQKIIVAECESYKDDYQLIFATSEINPLFENSKLVVGRYFSPSDRSLNLL